MAPAQHAQSPNKKGSPRAAFFLIGTAGNYMRSVAILTSVFAFRASISSCVARMP